MPTRIAPALPPFPPAIQETLEKIMPPGVPPLSLFTTMARDERLFGKFFAASLLDRGHLTLRHRALIIDRTTALCGSEYEGVSTWPSWAHVPVSRLSRSRR